MGYFRFQKRIKIVPGLRLNLSKGGASVSIGGRGLTANLSPRRGLTTTVSAPGTGVSRRDSWIPGKRDRHHHYDPAAGCLQTIGWLVFGCWIFFGTHCKAPAPPDTENTSTVWTPERVERSGIFKPAP
jgi:hypothetical protein